MQKTPMPAPAPKNGKTAPPNAKKERLAKALRENLLRRKQGVAGKKD